MAMCAHHEKPEGGYHMTAVAACILVMGISLAIVILLWAWFGHIGPKFSDEVMRQQQETLRAQYGFEPLPKITEEDAKIPPSLRNLNSN
ncbi:hypothetical protein NTE_01452 [Candidatus Nitrososphaera evergladensis SR1]|uniref:Uncharacterized protein n=2 Tax=Nitrososphaera TaxID=497726 RepID=A0A075MPM7_9ARCH|nr:hypothetical protein NTE_01452 [Candidatus Nitrososphaera evergladensis SR1]